MTFITRNKKIFAIAFWLLLWQFVASFSDKQLFFTSPLAVLTRLLEFLATFDFWFIISKTALRISCGILIGFLLGFILAVLAFNNKLMKILLAPLVLAIKSVPLVSIIMLLLLFISSHDLAFLVSGMMLLPIIYTNVLTGLDSADHDLLEMARVFRMSDQTVWRFIYIPSLEAQLSAGLELGIGMAWKAGLAAEVFGTPTPSIGEALYKAKIYLNTTDLFTWTLVLLMMSLIFEKLSLKILAIVLTKNKTTPTKLKPKKTDRTKKQQTPIVIKNLQKSYGEKEVFSRLNLKIEPGTITCIMGPSGIGKTTLLRIILGLEDFQAGTVEGVADKSFAVAFQENRLFEEFSICQNLAVTSVLDLEHAHKFGLTDLKQKVANLSGGMKRRVALLRAVLSDYEVLILDEPGQGLDEQLKQVVLSKLLKINQDRTIIFVTHDAEEARFFKPDKFVRL